ncbi:MAG TPA: hypothetical protein DCQ32_04045 [Cyanobacteria bacterium UBA8156]|jgi:ElaB/YqjD/DUF883 family membrane-anchored ribosome-binding protein|nr:hypothetical protein [Cyanobacteria bacterium UBA8156]
MSSTTLHSATEVDSKIKNLNLYPIDYPFETLVARINNNKLILDPDFQRKYKWDRDGWEKASRFIESALMRIPLPSCYFAENDQGNQMVIDGVQRLSSISKFLNNEFRLQGLKVFKELEGKSFEELGNYRTELETTTIRCIVLRRENPSYLIREIFARLNRGAVTLTDQEIRRALYPGSLNNLLKELGQDTIIQNFGLPLLGTLRRKSPKTLKELEERRQKRINDLVHEEQVLRYFALRQGLQNDLTSYNDVLKDLLDEYMEKQANISADEINNLREAFSKALSNCQKVFGEKLFTGLQNRQSLIYFDLQMHTIGTLSTDKLTSEYIDKVQKAYQNLFDPNSSNSKTFKALITGATQTKKKILGRHKKWMEILVQLDNQA